MIRLYVHLHSFTCIEFICILDFDRISSNINPLHAIKKVIIIFIILAKRRYKNAETYLSYK